MQSSISENIIGTVSHFFVTNRPLSLLVLVSALLFGILSFVLLPKQYNPEIVRPAFALSLTYEGATPTAARERVVYELNEKIQTVPGVDEVLLEVTDGATVEATVIFTVGYDATRAKVDLLAQLEQHSYLAQGFIGVPQVIEINPETIPVLHIVFSSASLGVGEVRSKVVQLSHQLAGGEGVSEVQVAGGYAPAVIVELDPILLRTAGMTAYDVAAAIEASQERRVTAGVRSGEYRIEFVAAGQVDNLEAIGLIPLKAGYILRDVATVYEGVSGSRSYVFHEAGGAVTEGVTLSVAKVEGSSAPVVTRTFLEQLEVAMADTAYRDISYQVVSDDGATAAAEIQGLMTNLITSIAIVTIVLLLFLSVRSALVVLVAIPMTLLIVFGLGLLFDQTMNRITLFALILSLGLLIDSAIVVVENIYSHLKEWQRAPAGRVRERAVAGAVHEIGIGLVLSTVTSVIVFLPMNYITGMMGPYMGPIAFFVPAALIVSLFVAATIVPFVAAYVIDPQEQPNRVTRFTTGIMDALTRRYTNFLRRVLDSRVRQRRLLRGALGLFLLSLLLPAFALVHFQMLPKADRDQFYLYLDLPVGTDVEETARVALAVGEAIQVDEDVLSIQYFVAEPPLLDFNGMFKGALSRTAPHEATLRVNLTPAAERQRSSTAIVTDIRQIVSSSPHAAAGSIRLMEEPPGPPVQATLVAKFFHEDEGVRAAVAAHFHQYLGGIAGVVDIDTSTDAATTRVRYEYDSVAGAARGVSPVAVMDTLALLGEPQPIGEFLAGSANEYTPILLTTAPALRANPSDLSGYSVPSEQGLPVPLTSVVSVYTEARPSAIQLEESRQLTYVTAEVEGRSIVYVVIELIRGLVRGDLADYHVVKWGLFGLSLEAPTGEVVELAWGGEWEMTLENFRDLGVAMGAALLLVYAVLVAQYKRFAVPAYILITVPLGLIGILWGFFVLDSLFAIYLTATALIGFIALIGIVVNNAIIYLEYVEQSLQAGRSRVEALLAAGQARLRPILLTSLTTVLGSLTIASDPVWSGLAWAIVFGLSLSTVLTLVVYPTMLVYFTQEE